MNPIRWDRCRVATRVLMGIVAVAALGTLELPAAAAQSRPDKPVVAAPDLDVRGAPARSLSEAAFAARATPPQKAAVEALREAVPGVRVRWSAVTGVPSRINKPGGALTEASDAPAREIAEGFLQSHLALFNLTAEDLSEWRYTRDAVSQNNGVTHLEIQQQVNGIDVFGAQLSINIDEQGRILNVGGEPIPAIRRGVRNATPTLTADAAIAAAAASAGLTALSSFRSDGLVYFPVARGDVRLAWNVVVVDAHTPNSYRTLVDAMTGAVLWRLNGTRTSHIATHGLVFDGDNPTPQNPIGSTNGATVPRADRLFHGAGQEFPRQLGTPIFGHGDVHFDWWNGAARDVTTSNNVQAQEDRNGDDAGGTQATTGGDDFFDDALDLTQDPSTYSTAAVTNLFYWVNRVHDIWYRYGFTEAFGNYQTDNFGLGGTGGDPVIADAQDNRDNGSLCNANFDTNATEGNPGRMQMFQCNSATPERDADFSNSTIIHEYHHGLGERLRPSLHGSCATSQGAAIGEGGGDFQGILVLAEPGDDPNGSYGHSQYRANDPAGVRRAPYSIRPGVYPFTYGDIATSSECHDAGEIWANTLWIARALLVGRYGFVNGTDTIMQLQLDGYKMSPGSPDFLDVRDAILAADVADNGGANQCLLWAAFARMGIGVSAASTGPDDTAPVEAFDTPPECTAQVSVSPSLLDFGPVPVNPLSGESGTKSLTFDVCSVGDATLFLTNATLQAPNPAFTVVPPAPDGFPLPISPDFCHPIEVQCNPSAAGTTTATVQIESTDGDDPLITPVTLSCTGAVPDVHVSGSTDFGEVCAGANAEKVVSVCNTGNSNLGVTGASVDCPDFTLVNNPFPATVSPDFCAPLTVRFTPTTAGPKSCHLTINSNDPDQPTVTLTLTASTPAAAIDVPPDQAFAPEVIQSIGACNTRLPFPISNTGSCPLRITNIAITDNPAAYSLSGLPSFPIILEPGHVAGEGNLKTVFAPLGIDRDVEGDISVTYVSEPITGGTTTVTRNLCGEGVATGVRILVTAGGVPLPLVEKIQLQRIVGNRNNSVDVANNLALASVTPALPCTPFQFHREYGGLSNPTMLIPGNYQVTAQVRIGNKVMKKSVFFDLQTCDFNRNVVIGF